MQYGDARLADARPRRACWRSHHVGFAYDAGPAGPRGRDVHRRARDAPSRWSGATASGKSTLATLLFRLVDPDRGRISVDGQDLRDLAAGRAGRRTPPWCPSRRSCSTTRSAATSPSGADVPDDEVWAALRTAQADGFVAALPGRARHAAGGARHHASRAASGSGSRWPARWSAGRGCWSWTTRRRRSTPRSRPGSWPRCARTRPTRPSWWSPTARRRSRSPTRWSSSRTAGSSTRGRTRRCSTATRAYADLVNAYEHEPTSARPTGRARTVSTPGATATPGDAPRCSAARARDRPGDPAQRCRAVARAGRRGSGSRSCSRCVATAGRVLVPIAVQQAVDRGIDAAGGPDVGFVATMVGAHRARRDPHRRRRRR